MNQDQVRVVVSGSTWLGSGLGSIESALLEILESAKNEVLIVAYSIGNVANLFFETISKLLDQGVRVLIIVNRFDQQHPVVQQRLNHLSGKYRGLVKVLSYVPSREQADLHAKIIVVDRRTALVGSANLSLRGLADNHELGIVLTGRAVDDVVKAVEKLIHSPSLKQVR